MTRQLCKNAAMPNTKTDLRSSLFSRFTWKLMAAAFAIGLLLFVVVWLRSRHTYDFYKADGSSASVQQDDALPAPLPPDVASGTSASGLGAITQSSGDAAAAPSAGEQPKLIEPPSPPPPPPAPAQQPTASASTLPSPIHAPAPRYPSDAMRQGAGGTVRVKISVAADGSVAQLDIVESSGNRSLDRAALETLRRWTFKPGTRNGQPIATNVVVPITFSPQ